MQFRDEAHLDATAAVRGGQGRRFRKQMGCKVGSALRRETPVLGGGKMGREGRRIGTEGKREAIVSRTHTGVGLDSFIGCARYRTRSERKRGRKRDRRGRGTRNGRGEKVNGNVRAGGNAGGGRRKREPCVAQFGDQWEK